MRRIALVLVAFGLAAGGYYVWNDWRNERAEVVAERMEPLSLRVYAYVDSDFTRRFGAADGAGRAKLEQWFGEVHQHLSREFPLEVSLVGVGTWELPHGALDGTVIFDKYVPESWPEESGANCMIALTGREGVYWSGISRWPRIFTKAQAAEPVDEKTVSVLCHEISHWFGAKDIIDADFPERTVMNYRDKRFGFVDGRIVWDDANRKRILRGVTSRR